MTSSISYRRHRFPPEIIAHAVSLWRSSQRLGDMPSSSDSTKSTEVCSQYRSPKP